MAGNFFGGAFFGGGFFGQAGAGVRGTGGKRDVIVDIQQGDRQTTDEFLKDQLRQRNPFEPIPEPAKPVRSKKKAVPDEALKARALEELKARELELYNENVKILLMLARKK